MIGHVFWDEALERIAPAATAALDGLMRRELAYGRDTSAFEGTREFIFKHHVLHQVAYQGVLKQSRKEQHRLTADWLVVRSGDRASEYFGLIAEHYERAGDVDNALTYLRNEGEEATRIGHVYNRIVHVAARENVTERVTCLLANTQRADGLGFGGIGLHSSSSLAPPGRGWG